MKRNLLAIAIPALLIAGAANASIEIFNKDGNKLEINGRVKAMNNLGTKGNTDNPEGDRTNARFGFTGETQVMDSVVGYGRAEWETTKTGSLSANSTENRYAFAGLKFGHMGSIDYGRNDGIVKMLTAYTDVLPEFGGQAGDYLLGSRANAVLTYRNSDFFGMVDGFDMALQYADNSTSTTTNSLLGTSATTGPEAFGLAVEYAILDSGVSVAATYAQTSEEHKDKVWAAGVKYDANNLYVAGLYIEEKIKSSAGDIKVQGFETVAQYGIDLGVGRLTPSLAYIQHKNKETDLFLHKYVDVGATYDFNKNLSAVVDYKINLLKDKDVTVHANTKNTLALGLVYQF